MLGTPNFTLTDGAAPIIMRPTAKAGVYVWESATADQPLNVIAKTTPSEKKSRFSMEFVRLINNPTAGQPDLKIRVYTVCEIDNSTAIPDSMVTSSLAYLNNSLNATNVLALRRGEV